MSKQTAVELLVSILNKDGFTPVLTDEEIQHFKQMEKEQIEMACNQQEFEDFDGLGICETISKGEQYYNETYGGIK